MTTMTRMTKDAPTQGLALHDLTALAESQLSGDPAWLRSIRETAISAFKSLGLPTRRDEEWRMMNLRPITEAQFVLADETPQVSADDLKKFDIDGLAGPRLVFVNGLFDKTLSDFDDLPQGVQVTTFLEAEGDAAKLLEQHLAQYADHEQHAFTALNTAFLEDGVLVHVAKDIKSETPIRVLNVTTAPQKPLLTNTRHLVVAESGSQVTVVEDYVSLSDEDVYLTNAVTEIVVGENADVRHYLIERESRKAWQVSTLNIKQEENSKFVSHSMLLGGEIVRNNVNPVLDGEHCFSVLNGLYLGCDSQQLDNHMRVDHAMPNCDSRQYYHGVLTDKSQGTFSGRIVVARDAQKTDAVQSNRNLLLSDGAKAHTKPQLEIYADDVKCTHGATIGEIDAEALLYLRSRGIPEASARAMMVFAFASEGLERIEVEPIQRMMRTVLLDRLPGSAALKDILSDNN